MKLGELLQVTWVDAVEGAVGLIRCNTVGFVTALTEEYITLAQTQTEGEKDFPSDSCTSIPRSSIKMSRAVEAGRKRTVKPVKKSKVNTDDRPKAG